MVSAVNGDGVETVNENGCELKHHISLQISISRKGLLSDEHSPEDFPENVSNVSTRLKMLKISPKGNVGRSIRKQFNSKLFKEIDWPSIANMCKEWVRKPLNIALLLWVVCVVVSGGILFLVMTGMLNSTLPKKSQRELWFEVNNQIISALFTLMCLYLHPKRFHHLLLLCRWSSTDVSQLRKVYCKNSSYKPNERVHMMVVIILLHINCFAQYGLCGLNLGFRRANRSVIGVGVCLAVAIASPAVAGLYSTLSPLGKDYDFEVEESSLEKKYTFATRDERVIVENKPKWRGGLFSLWEDLSVAYLSLLCCFCVFGWNMERLGFGNMYVHIVTFLLFCTAPFWIFNLAGVIIDHDSIREILGICGIALSMFGLLYGGFWRIQMRKRFNLPHNKCVSKPDIADCAQWLFCCWCSLAQEVRTGDFYEIVEDGFYRRNGCGLTPLPREGGAFCQATSNLSSSYWVNSKLAKMDETVIEPPVPATIGMPLRDSKETLLIG